MGRSQINSRRQLTCKQQQLRSGAVAVEFALTLPLLFLMLFGAIELSHANMVFHAAEAAAYEGARAGILPGATATDCEQAAQRVLDISRVRQSDVSVTPSNLDTESTTVVVEVSVVYSRNTIITPLYTDSLVIRRSCELTRE
ncbi:MAG: pilus assembly protein [Aureliella sp.]